MTFLTYITEILWTALRVIGLAIAVFVIMLIGAVEAFVAGYKAMREKIRREHNGDR